MAHVFLGYHIAMNFLWHISRSNWLRKFASTLYILAESHNYLIVL